MAGSEQHAAMLREMFPEAVSVECDPATGFASVLMAGENMPRHGRCPGCEQDAIINAVAEFTPPRFSAAVHLPERVAAWAAKGRKAEGLYLCGPVGTGKTHTAWSAVAAWCAAASVRPYRGYQQDDYLGSRWHSPNVVFARLVDLLDDFRPGDDSVRRVRDCQRCELLVIDDLGAEKASEWTQERLYSVIDHRYAECLPVLVTGNLPPRVIADQSGDRVASRLAEMCAVVPFDGPDRRKPTP